jgi:hypothetical protein
MQAFSQHKRFQALSFSAGHAQKAAFDLFIKYIIYAPGRPNTLHDLMARFL